jgi:REP element-mobilizing transposase RayT
MCGAARGQKTRGKLGVRPIASRGSLHYAAARAAHAALHRSRYTAARHPARNQSRSDLRRAGRLAFFQECLAHTARKHDAAIHAYVLMTNHVHLLATPQLATSLPKLMQAIGRIYVQYFNSGYRRCGPLWPNKTTRRGPRQLHVGRWLVWQVRLNVRWGAYAGVGNRFLTLTFLLRFLYLHSNNRGVYLRRISSVMDLLMRGGSSI